MFGAIAILAALREREATGRGGLVQSGLFETNMVLMAQHMARAAIEGEDFPEAGPDDPAGLLDRHDRVAGRWLAMVRDVERRDAWDDRIIDALCDPPESFVLGSILAHVLTFSAARRQLARMMMRRHGLTVDDGDPITWLRQRAGQEEEVTS